MPVRRRLAPTGCKPRSKLVRQRPSNMCAPGTGTDSQGTSGFAGSGGREPATTLRAHRLGGARAPRTQARGGSVEDLSDAARSATWRWSATAEPGRPPWPRRCCCGPGPSTGSGRVEDGTTVCDFDPEEQKRSHLAVARARPVRVGGPQGQPDRHARATPTSSATSQAALRVADLAVFVVSAVEGVEVQTEAIWRIAADARPAPHDLRQQARPRAGRLRAHARAAARPRSAPASPRSSCPIGEEAAFRGVADLLTDKALLLRRTARTTDGEIPDELDGARAPGARQPRRGHRRRRRRAARALPRRRRARASTSSSTRSPSGVADATVFPVVCGSATTRRRRSTGWPTSSARSAPRPLDRRRVEVHGRRLRAVEVAPDAERPAARLRVQDDRRPLRRPALALQGAVGHGEARRPPRRTRASGADERLHGLFTLRGKEQDAVTSVAGRRHRRGGQAGRHRAPATRSPRRARRCASPASSRPPPVLAHRGPAAHPGRRRQARHRARTASRTRTRRSCSSATTRPTRRCCGAPARPTCTIALERLAAQVRRRRRHRRRAGALPRDDHAAGRGRGQVQEAVRRPRPVRRGVPPRRAARPGRGLRVRRQDRRRRHPPPVHPRGAEGHRGDDGRRRRVRLPGRRREGRRASTASTTRSTRRR